MRNLKQVLQEEEREHDFGSSRIKLRLCSSVLVLRRAFLGPARFAAVKFNKEGARSIKYLVMIHTK